MHDHYNYLQLIKLIKMETIYKRQVRLVSLSKGGCWYKVLACANSITNDMCDRNIISDKFEITEINTHESNIYVS